MENRSLLKVAELTLAEKVKHYEAIEEAGRREMQEREIDFRLDESNKQTLLFQEAKKDDFLQKDLSFITPDEISELELYGTRPR